jgi:hypothetical protein
VPDIVEAEALSPDADGLSDSEGRRSFDSDVFVEQCGRDSQIRLEDEYWQLKK